jgi:NitT/TauT family transport system substrate-binding protein
VGSQDADPGRRDLLTGVGTTGLAALVGLGSGPAHAEPPPETTRIRLARFPFDVSCVAPQLVAEDLLRAEGFTSIEYVTARPPLSDPLAAGEFDLTLHEAFGLILALDAGKPVVALGGIHGGCYLLVGSDPAMAAHVGLDPRKDIEWVVRTPAEGK